MLVAGNQTVINSRMLLKFSIVPDCIRMLFERCFAHLTRASSVWHPLIKQIGTYNHIHVIYSERGYYLSHTEEPTFQRYSMDAHCT